MAIVRKKRRYCRVSSDSETDTDTEPDLESDSDQDNSRGRTVLAKVRKKIQNGGKIKLEWNASKVPCGKHRTTFGTYVGVIAREYVNINYEKWTHLPEELVNEVYNEIAKTFVVLPERRRWILSRAAERWRAFKSRLVRKYMYKKSGKIRRKAPSKYPFILQSDWEKFISYCTSDKFKEKSRKSQARSKMKMSRYRGGRRGYQYYNQEIIEEFEAQGIHIEQAPRHLSWLKAHKKKSDESYAPGDMEIAEAIIALDAQAQKGEISATGRDDILARVLKKPEHGGCVRGVGSGISNREYFGPAERPKVAQLQNQIETLQSQVTKLLNMQQFMMAFFMSCGQQTALPFNPEQMRQLMAGGSGFNFDQITSGNGQSSQLNCSGGQQVGGSSGQLGGFGQLSQFGAGELFASSRKSGLSSQNVNATESLVSSEPVSRRHRKSGTARRGRISESDTDH